MREKGPKFTPEEIEEKQNGIEREKEPEKILLLDTLKKLLEAQQISEEEINRYAEKFLDLKNPEGILLHISEPKNLERILKEGILSHKFVERASMTDLPGGFEPVQQDKYGMDYISFYDSDVFNVDRKEWGLEDRTFLGFISEWGNGDTRVGIVIDKSKLPMTKQQSQKIEDWIGEVLIKPRIAPVFFNGLMIGRECKVESDKIRFIYEHIRKKELLIYSTEGDQIWPVRRKREEIEEKIRQKHEAEELEN